MILISSAETRHSSSENSQVDRPDTAFLRRPVLLSKTKLNSSRPEFFHPEGMQRLSIAIINRAVLDLLENGRHSSGAERWLLSREFDRIHDLLG